MRARRDDKSDPFPAGEAITELNEQCSDLSRAIDISDDGLRVYFGCAYDAVGPETVYFGQRPDRSQPFTIDPMPLVSGAGRQFDVTRSELVAFSSSNPIGASPLTYTRSAPMGPFGDGGPVLGLETTVFAWPTLANDDRTLFGTQSGVLVSTTRPAPDAAFGAVVPIPLPGTFYSSVAISADCRSLYYLNGLEDLTVWNLEVLRR
jgi:hypothetical protein